MRLSKTLSTYLTLLFFSVVLVATPCRAEKKKYVPDPEITARIASNPQLINQKLVDSMNKLLNNPATLTIKLIPFNKEETAKGHFKNVFVHTSRGNIDGVVLHKAEMLFEEVQLDTRKLILEDKVDPVEVSNISMDVVIRENDMNSFLKAKSKDIKVRNPNVRMRPGKIELSGYARYGMVKVKFWATGGFSVKDSKEIWFHARKMKINHMSMPRSFVGMIVKRINPVLQLDKFPFKLNLSEIRIDNGEMTFTSFRKNKKGK